jgi:aerobic-type carbon monoxide dehydrogenase small subunit (CoxS/CutS family)
MSKEFDIKDAVPIERLGRIVEGKFIPEFNVICPYCKNGNCTAYSMIKELQRTINELEEKIKRTENE